MPRGKIWHLTLTLTLLYRESRDDSVGALHKVQRLG